ncbi:TolB family protein [candidate division KSB1 bacterium]
MVNLSNTEVHDDHPAWSPDGQMIVFDSMRDWPPGYVDPHVIIYTEIYMMKSDGTQQTRLTFVKSRNITPAWSPIIK